MPLSCALFSELLFSVSWIFWSFSRFLVYTFFRVQLIQPQTISWLLLLCPWLINSHNSSAAPAILLTRLCPFCITCFYSHSCNLIFYGWIWFFLFSEEQLRSTFCDRIFAGGKLFSASEFKYTSYLLIYPLVVFVCGSSKQKLMWIYEKRKILRGPDTKYL